MLSKARPNLIPGYLVAKQNYLDRVYERRNGDLNRVLANTVANPATPLQNTVFASCGLTICINNAI